MKPPPTHRLARPASTARPHWPRHLVLAAGVAAAFGPTGLLASTLLQAPRQLESASGLLSVGQQGAVTTLQTSPGAVLNWQRFNIGEQETVRFIQTSSDSSVLNRITGQDASHIMGQLQSNGRVFLINRNGILFGPNATVDVKSLVASTLALSDSDMMAGRLRFLADPANNAGGSLIQQGTINAAQGGHVYLVGSSVRNEGSITANGGHIVLAAGRSVELAPSASGLLSVTVDAPAGQAVNIGHISASGGRIDLYGAIVRHTGSLNADSAVIDETGRIVLQAAQNMQVDGRLSAVNAQGQGGDIRIVGPQINIGANSHIDASGQTGGGRVLIGGGLRGRDATLSNADTTHVADGAVVRADALHSGNGGQIVTYARDHLSLNGMLQARGGPLSGNGGLIETSAAQLTLRGRIDAGASAGDPGQWLIDPRRVCIFQTTASECSAGTNPFNQAGLYQTSSIPGGTGSDTLVSVSDLNAALIGGQLRIEADELISILPSGGMWTLTNGTDGPGHATFESPIIYLNGSVRNIGGNSGFFSSSGNGLILSANNPSSLTAPSVPATDTPLGSSAPATPLTAAGLTGFANNSIVLGPTAQITSDFARAGVALFAKHFDFAGGSSIALIRPAADNPTQLSTAVQFFGESFTGGGITMNNGGLTIQAERYEWSPQGRWTFTGTPLSLDVRNFNILLNADELFETQVRLASSSCAGSTGLCLSADALNQWSTGSGSVDRMTIRFSRGESPSVTLQVGALPTLPAGVIQFVSASDIHVTAPLTRTVGDLVFKADRNIVVDASAPIRILDGSLYAVARNAVVVSAPLQARDTLLLARQTDFVVTDTVPAGVRVGATLSAARVRTEVNTFNDQQLEASFLSNGANTVATLQFLPGVTLTSDAASTLANELINDSTGPVVRISVPTGIFARAGHNATLVNDAGSGLLAIGDQSFGWQISTAAAPTGTVINHQFGGLDQAATAQPNQTQATVNVCGGLPESTCNTNTRREFTFNSYNHLASTARSTPPPPPPAPPPPAPPPPTTQTPDVCQLYPSHCALAPTSDVATSTRRNPFVEVAYEPTVQTPPARIRIATPINSANSAQIVRTIGLQDTPGAADQPATPRTVRADQWQLNTPTEQAVFQSRTSGGDPRTWAEAFSPVQMGALSMLQRKALLELRRGLKEAIFASAAAMLRNDESAARLPACNGQTDICVPEIPPSSAGIEPRGQKGLAQRKHALVIGIDHYADPNIPPLGSARHDANAVARQLKARFSYEVTNLQDASRDDMVRALRQLAVDSSPQDTVTLYFAGHGYQDPKTGKGYWIASDARASTPDRWLSNDDITRLLAQIPAQQILLVSDSCFSGTLVRDIRNNVDLLRNPAVALNRRTVVALSSGGDEPVSDEGSNGHSIFAEQFLAAMDRVTGLDLASRMFQTIREGVMQQLPQTPQYGGLSDARHESGGEYLIESTARSISTGRLSQ